MEKSSDLNNCFTNLTFGQKNLNIKNKSDLIGASLGHQPNIHCKLEENGDQILVNSGTYPSVGADTIDDAPYESTHDRTDTHLPVEFSKHTESDFAGLGEKCQDADDVTEFLMEINKLNSSLLNRKKCIKEKMATLQKELQILEDSTQAPAAIVGYINNQRNLRERVKYALKTGSTKFDHIQSSDLLPPVSQLDQTDVKYQVNRRVPQNELVFVTEKTEGYKKEQEKLRIEREKERHHMLKSRGNFQNVPDFKAEDYYNAEDIVPGYLDHGIDQLDYFNDEGCEKFDQLYENPSKRYSGLFEDLKSGEPKNTNSNLIG